jgi:hypothetical protein
MPVLDHQNKERPMGFNLEVTITGLCVFRPDPANNVMDVLMVGSSHHPRHYPRVFYDAAHDSSTPIGKASRRISLDESVLDLSQFKGAGGNLGPVPDLVDTGAIAQPKKLPSRADEKDKKNQKALVLSSRVTLPPGSITSPKPSGPWELQLGGTTLGSLPHAAWHVVWTITGIQTAQLDWELKGLRDSYGQQLQPLKPLPPPPPPQDGWIRLLISNVVLEESEPFLMLGVNPGPKSPMPHFDAYQEIYGASGAWPDLVFMGNQSPPPGTPYSCLPSGGH